MFIQLLQKQENCKRIQYDTAFHKIRTVSLHVLENVDNLIFYFDMSVIIELV